MVARRVILEQLAQLIASVERPHPVRVAIDGVDAAGKTTPADELVAPIEEHGRPVIRASCDGFHRVRADRYQRGRDSPEGYYYDSFDYEAIRSALLVPLGPGGSGRYRSIAFDLDTNSSAHEPLCQAPPECVLLFDGVFLLRPELNDHWDIRVSCR
jgi:uridine kinase